MLLVSPTGVIDASKTGFMHYSSTVVCAAGTSHPLTIETRDSFNNLAAYRADQSKHFFKIKVEEVGLTPVTLWLPKHPEWAWFG